jgi:hypothetical protein
MPRIERSLKGDPEARTVARTASVSTGDGKPVATFKLVRKVPKDDGPPKTPVAAKKEKVWARDKWGKWDWR